MVRDAHSMAQCRKLIPNKRAAPPPRKKGVISPTREPKRGKPRLCSLSWRLVAGLIATQFHVIARTLRLETAGGIYHVINRGNYRADIFHSEKAKQTFLTCLGEACEHRSDPA